MFASNLGGRVRSYALRSIAYIDGRVIVASLIVSCDNLTIGVAPDEADPLIERLQALKYLGRHRPSDYVSADHDEVGIDALEIYQDSLKRWQVGVYIVDGCNTRALLNHTCGMILLFAKPRESGALGSCTVPRASAVLLVNSDVCTGALFIAAPSAPRTGLWRFL
ncbi:MAG TPA: hypothetical protein VNT12_03110 [Rubrobacter sp.]|nr:hypothetical protein [Rubrobacter sp.]